ncbi:MAG: TraR/DksA family transcriptional regulator [Desulfobacteraceae bacterium]
MEPEPKKRRRPLQKEEIDQIRANLLKREEELWKEILQDLENDTNKAHKEVIDILREYGDMALDELRESTAISLIEVKYDELKNIEKALDRIDSGEYGRCLDCGRWINPARLEALPYAIRCRRCQSAYEKSVQFIE